MREKTLLFWIISFSISVLAVSCTKDSSRSRYETDDNATEAMESNEDFYKTEIIEAVEKWNKSLNLRDEKMSAEVYASDVEFYGQNLSAEKCSEIRVDRATSDPTWHQEIISDINLERLDDNSFIASFTKQSNSRKGTHTYPAYLILKKFHDGWKVINESDKLTDKNLKKSKSRKVPENTVRGDFDGDGKIDNIWTDPVYDSEGYVKGEVKLLSDNPDLEGLTWNTPRGVILINIGDLNNSGRDFLGAIPCCDSSWTIYETYGFKNGDWIAVVPQFSIYTGNEDYNRVWKSSRKGYVVISSNDMSDIENGYENSTREIRLDF